MNFWLCFQKDKYKIVTWQSNVYSWIWSEQKHIKGERVGFEIISFPGGGEFLIVYISISEDPVGQIVVRL